MKWRTLILLILCTPQSKGYLGSDSVCQVKWQNEFCVYRHHALRNVVLQSHLRRLPWRRMPINIKTHFYFTRAHSNSPGYPLDEKYIYESFGCPPTIKLFSKLYRHSKDTCQSGCELLHIWKPKYSCKVKGYRVYGPRIMGWKLGVESREGEWYIRRKDFRIRIMEE